MSGLLTLLMREQPAWLGARERDPLLWGITLGVPLSCSLPSRVERGARAKKGQSEKLQNLIEVLRAATVSLEHGMEPVSGAVMELCSWQGGAPGLLVPSALPARVLGYDVNTHRSQDGICSYTSAGV